MVSVSRSPTSRRRRMLRLLEVLYVILIMWERFVIFSASFFTFKHVAAADALPLAAIDGFFEKIVPGLGVLVMSACVPMAATNALNGRHTALVFEIEPNVALTTVLRAAYSPGAGFVFALGGLPSAALTWRVVHPVNTPC